jgi:hypothetical protein
MTVLIKLSEALISRQKLEIDAVMPREVLLNHMIQRCLVRNINYKEQLTAN